MPYCDSLLVVFAITPPPPTAPLFPYTTLFRSPGRGGRAGRGGRHQPARPARTRRCPPRPHGRGQRALRLSAAVPRLRPCRSEEHTSELQSRVDLVCRLLLEKKKK